MRPATSMTTSTPGSWREAVRQIPGEVALQVRRDGSRDLLGRQRRERLESQNVAGHHHAHQLRRDELDANDPASRRIVDAWTHFDRDHFLDERTKQVDL